MNVSIFGYLRCYVSFHFCWCQLIMMIYDDSICICRFCMILFRITQRHSHGYASASMYMNAYRHILNTHTHVLVHLRIDKCRYMCILIYKYMYILYRVREHVQLHIRIISSYDSDCNPPPTQGEYPHPPMVVVAAVILLDTYDILWWYYFQYVYIYIYKYLILVALVQVSTTGI